MTKRELVKWLEKEKAEAVEKAEKDYKKAIEELKEHYYKELHVDELVDKVQPLFSQIHEEYTKFCDDIDSINDVTVSRYGYKWRFYDIERLSYKPDLKASIIEAIHFTNYHEISEKDRILRVQRHKVGETYDTVIQTVKNLPTYKEGIEYLKKLGFDTSKIVPSEPKKQLPATINVNVDIKYLLLNKDKDNEVSE